VQHTTLVKTREPKCSEAGLERCQEWAGNNSISPPIFCCDIGHSFSPVLAASFQTVRGVMLVEITMAALFIGYFTAIAIV
jgi:hypothetical protein